MCSDPYELRPILLLYFVSKFIDMCDDRDAISFLSPSIVIKITET